MLHPKIRQKQIEVKQTNQTNQKCQQAKEGNKKKK